MNTAADYCIVWMGIMGINALVGFFGAIVAEEHKRTPGFLFSITSLLLGLYPSLLFLIWEEWILLLSRRN